MKNLLIFILEQKFYKTKFYKINKILNKLKAFSKKNIFKGHE